jgi:hypothetical protein
MSIDNALALADSWQFNVPTSVVSGQPLLVGTLAVVATETYLPPTGINPSGQVNCALKGAFFLTCTAQSLLSPATNVAINQGDKLYADGGTLDSTTNVTYNFTLDKNTGGVLFGSALTTLVSGTTGIVMVRLKLSS